MLNIVAAVVLGYVGFAAFIFVFACLLYGWDDWTDYVKYALIAPAFMIGLLALFGVIIFLIQTARV